MAELKKYEVNGSYTVTVSIGVLAHSEEEAMDMVENMGIDITEYIDGSVGSDEARLTADGYVEWNSASEDFCYLSEDDVLDEDDCVDYWYDEYQEEYYNEEEEE